MSDGRAPALPLARLPLTSFFSIVSTLVTIGLRGGELELSRPIFDALMWSEADYQRGRSGWKLNGIVGAGHGLSSPYQLMQLAKQLMVADFETR